jgi:hypothetical protein
MRVQLWYTVSELEYVVNLTHSKTDGKQIPLRGQWDLPLFREPYEHSYTCLITSADGFETQEQLSLWDSGRDISPLPMRNSCSEVGDTLSSTLLFDYFRQRRIRWSCLWDLQMRRVMHLTISLCSRRIALQQWENEFGIYHIQLP